MGDHILHRDGSRDLGNNTTGIEVHISCFLQIYVHL